MSLSTKITRRAGGSLIALMTAALILGACVVPPPAAPAPVATVAPTEVAPAPTATSAPATPEPSAAAPTAAPGSAVEAPTGVTTEGYFYRGDPDAKVKLVEWSDFQCPYCARHATETAPQLDEQYVAAGKVQHVFRNLPLDFHPEALPAAKAAYCAGQQDPAFFWKMHDWLFQNQGGWAGSEDAAKQFRDQVISLKADGAAFDACLTAPETQAVMDRDLAEAATLQIAGTPSFYINDWFLGGAYPFEAFQEAIGNAEQGIHPAPTATPLPEGIAPYDADPARPGLTYDGSPTRGDPKARLVLVAFEDFKCGYCAQHASEVGPQLKAKYIDTGEMREVFKFLPIYAPNAAVASLCALEQGKFWEFHDVLFKEQANWEESDAAAMLAYAKQLGLDEAKFQQCLDEGRYRDQVESEGGLAQQLGFGGTPSFVLIDTVAGTGLPITGALPMEEFESTVQNLLNPPTPTPTVTPAP